jgi:hypothetical protein
VLAYSSFLLNNGDRLLVADVDHDGDGDIVVNATWYRNDGIGLLITAMGTWAPAGTSAAALLKDLDGDGTSMTSDGLRPVRSSY